MSTHTRAQLGRAVRLVLIVVAALITTAPIQNAVAQYPAAGAVVAGAEILWRQFFPTIPVGRILDAYRQRQTPPPPPGPASP